MRRCFLLACWGVAIVFGGLLASAQADEAEQQKPEPIPELPWHTDYAAAAKTAAAERKMLFIFFHDATMTAARRSFEEKTLRDPAIFEQLGRYVLLTLPLDASIPIKHEPVRLLDHPAFREMHGRQGIAVIDYEHEQPEIYGYVVSTFPFTSGKYYVPISLSAILDLPLGTLTQRTMIYAVRLHPEKPLSTAGQLSPVLTTEASRHSSHQAAILLQGHHNWDSRFQRISAKLPGGGTAQEVVAESWPNETLVEACVDCVDSWRQSPGHWGAVRGRHPFFGYDIKLGRNGIWYATGIFGRR